MRSLLAKPSAKRSTLCAAVLCAAGAVAFFTGPDRNGGAQAARPGDGAATADSTTGRGNTDFYAGRNFGAYPGSSAADGHPGTTRPSQQRDLGFNVPGSGIVQEVFVKDGDVVEEGMLVATLRETVERRELAVMKLEAGLQADLEIEAAEMELAAKEVEFDKQEDLKKSGDHSETEYHQAKVAVDIAKVKVNAAKAAKQKAALRVELQEEQMKLKRLFAPISGVVTGLEAGAGEVADPTKPALTIVQNDPLWVEVNVPVEAADSLRKGQTLQVRYEGEQEWQPATIILFSPVGDAGAGTQPIRLEMANPQGRASGRQVLVRLTDEDDSGEATAAAAAEGGE